MERADEQARRGPRLPRALALALALASLSAAEPARAGRPIYAFTAPDGTIHFSDVRRDARYQRLPEPKRAITPVRRSAPRSGDYDGLIGLTARQHQVEPALIKAVIAAESNFDPEAISQKGAQGLMQLMPRTASRLGVDDPLDAIDNVRGGTRYLRLMLDRYGDVERAVAAYNAGPGAVDRHGGVPPYPETRDYVRKVMTYYRYYHGDFTP